MSQRFDNASKEWDKNTLVQTLSENIGSTMLRYVNFNPMDRVLDFGAGTGLLIEKIKEQVAHIDAVDTSEGMLHELSKKEHLKSKVTPICQNILEAPLNQHYNVIVSAMAMHHVKETTTLLKTFYSHLTPGGVLAVADLNSEDGTFHQDNTGVEHFGFDKETLKEQLMMCGFSDISFVTACKLEKENKTYEVFLLCAKRA